MSTRRQATADRARRVRLRSASGDGSQAVPADGAQSAGAATPATAAQTVRSGEGPEPAPTARSGESPEAAEHETPGQGAAAAGTAPAPQAAPAGPRIGRLPVRVRSARAARPARSSGAGGHQDVAAAPPVRVPASEGGPAPADADGLVQPGPPAGAGWTGSLREPGLADAAGWTETGPGNGALARPEAEVATGLSARLMALARMIQIGHARSGRDGFSEKLLADAEDVLARAGERMRLSSSHTVVVLAGGTGSGKSSLFNRVAGADFSAVGVTRPVTRQAHACVWGQAGSGAILDWLNVPGRHRFSRASALDSGEDDLAGLVLLDLPDHDSVMSHAGELVDELVSKADVMVWVLDPQKYADGAVHRRFLVPLASHADVLAVVLNQADLLDPAEADDCVADLRRLLDSENLHDLPVLVTSAVTGAGTQDLRQLLVDAVAARRAAVARITADVDDVVTRFEPYAGDAAPAAVAPAQTESLAKELTAAAGVDAVCETLRSARVLRAVDFVGWPIAWFVERLTGRDPIRKARLGVLWNDLRSVTAGPAGAQQAEIDNALTDLGDELATSLPKPWSNTVRTAVRSRADDIPAAVGSAIAEVVPAEDTIAWWWRLAGLWQGLLLGAAAVGVVWLALILAFGVFHAVAGMPALLSKISVLPWVGGGTVAVLALGAWTSWACLRLVRASAEYESRQVTAAVRDKIKAVADEMVVIPAEQELSEFARYREETGIAARGAGQALAG